jgi:hypothetical protein
MYVGMYVSLCIYIYMSFRDDYIYMIKTTKYLGEIRTQEPPNRKQYRKSLSRSV